MYKKIILLCLPLFFVSTVFSQENVDPPCTFSFEGDKALPQGSFLFRESEEVEENNVHEEQPYALSFQYDDDSLKETIFIHDNPEFDQHDLLFEHSCVFFFQDEDDLLEENNSFPNEEDDTIEKKTPPFEKIYVSPFEVLTTYEGTFYLSPMTGEYEPVRAIKRDGKGTYIIKIAHECPICGRYCYGKTPPEGYSCPLWKKEVFPHIWAEP